MMDIYALDWAGPLGDDEHDARLIQFPGWENTMGLKHFADKIPTPAYFESHPYTVSHTDYPYNDVLWSIMSAHLLETITLVGQFQHKRYSIVMLNEEVPPAERLNADGTYKPDAMLQASFAAVEVQENIDCFDHEHSVYMPDEENPGGFFAIQQLVLKEPSDGFPPLFHVVGIPLTIFTTQNVKDAVEAANLKGFAFIPLADYIY